MTKQQDIENILWEQLSKDIDKQIAIQVWDLIDKNVSKAEDRRIWRQLNFASRMHIRAQNRTNLKASI